MGVTNEYQLANLPEGWGVWGSKTVSPNEFVEASGDASITVAYSLLTMPCLVFDDTADTGDTAYHICVLPATFKQQMESHSAALWFVVYADSVSQNASTTNDDLDLEVSFVIRPGPTSADQTEITIGYKDCNLGNTLVQDPAIDFGGEHVVDVMSFLTDAQKEYIVPGTMVQAIIRPSETVGTNVALVVAGAEWRWKENVKYSPTANVTA